MAAPRTLRTETTCLTHLLRRCRLVTADHPYDTFDAGAQAVSQQALGVRDRYQAGTISTYGVAVGPGYLMRYLQTPLAQPSAVADAQQLARHLSRECMAIWSFLVDPSIDATNWRAEQAIRPAIVTRKVRGGNRSWADAERQPTFASVLRATTQRDLSPHVVFASLAHARTPHVTAELN